MVKVQTTEVYGIAHKMKPQGIVFVSGSLLHLDKYSFGLVSIIFCYQFIYFSVVI
jgi:hypothetical protein